jgi:hypothetical protein
VAEHQSYAVTNFLRLGIRAVFCLLLGFCWAVSAAKLSAKTFHFTQGMCKSALPATVDAAALHKGIVFVHVRSGFYDLSRRNNLTALVAKFPSNQRIVIICNGCGIHVQRAFPHAIESHLLNAYRKDMAALLTAHPNCHMVYCLGYPDLVRPVECFKVIRALCAKFPAQFTCLSPYVLNDNCKSGKYAAPPYKHYVMFESVCILAAPEWHTVNRLFDRHNPGKIGSVSAPDKTFSQQFLHHEHLTFEKFMAHVVKVRSELQHLKNLKNVLLVTPVHRHRLHHSEFASLYPKPVAAISPAPSSCSPPLAAAPPPPPKFIACAGRALTEPQDAYHGECLELAKLNFSLISVPPPGRADVFFVPDM